MYSVPGEVREREAVERARERESRGVRRGDRSGLEAAPDEDAAGVGRERTRVPVEAGQRSARVRVRVGRREQRPRAVGHTHHLHEVPHARVPARGGRSRSSRSEEDHEAVATRVVVRTAAGHERGQRDARAVRQRRAARLHCLLSPAAVAHRVAVQVTRDARQRVVGRIAQAAEHEHASLQVHNEKVRVILGQLTSVNKSTRVREKNPSDVNEKTKTIKLHITSIVYSTSKFTCGSVWLHTSRGTKAEQ